MMEGALVLWFSLTLLSLIYLTYDLIFVTPAMGVMKVGWWLVILYTGPIGLFFYLLSCKEPMPGTHDAFIAPLWKQSLGSMVHCLAGDVTGIIVAAFILTFFKVSPVVEITIEYLAGFAFGLFIFQSLFMKNMMGGTYLKALRKSFYPEWLSMNMIMAGMIPTMVAWTTFNPGARNPEKLQFWGMMSLACIIGGLTAFSINRWLVKNKLKHGMMTARSHAAHMAPMASMGKKKMAPKVTAAQLYTKLCLTLLGLLVGIIIAVLWRNFL